MKLWSWLNENSFGALVFSWVKVFTSVVLGLFLADGADLFSVEMSDVRTWVTAGLAAVLPLIINWFNPMIHDTE